ncbi:MAG: hypothetical protein ACYC0A_06790 [Lutibacter sp.]
MEKSYDLIFYYPQHFNRSENGTNPFFDPLIAICEENKLRYLIIEEPDRETAFPRNKKAYQFDVYFYLILLLRKMIPLFFFKQFENREQCIGKILKNLTLGKFSTNVVFTISNSMGGFWRGYCPKAIIIDYQHGIINKKQLGFFINGQAAPLHIAANNKEVAVWGKGFKNVFDQDKNYYENKVHVLGHYQQAAKIATSFSDSNKILFSLQFMPDLGIKLNTEMFNEIRITIEKFNTLSAEKRPQIILRNHPRHNNAVDLSSLFNEFDFVSLMADKEILMPTDYLIHGTFFSTTAFEMALQGVPTFFLYTENLMNGKVDFLEDYQYPINQNFSLEELWTTYKNDKEVWMTHSDLVKKWSNHFFEPLNQQVFLDIVKSTKNKKNEG